MIPSLPITNKPSQKERMAALSLSCDEMGTITAKLKIAQVLRSKLLPATKFIHIAGDNGKAYQKKDGK